MCGASPHFNVNTFSPVALTTETDNIFHGIRSETMSSLCLGAKLCAWVTKNNLKVCEEHRAMLVLTLCETIRPHNNARTLSLVALATKTDKIHMNQLWYSDSFVPRHNFLCLNWLRKCLRKLHTGYYLQCNTKTFLDCSFAYFEFYWLQIWDSFWENKTLKIITQMFLKVFREYM